MPESELEDAPQAATARAGVPHLGRQTNQGRPQADDRSTGCPELAGSHRRGQSPCWAGGACEDW